MPIINGFPVNKDNPWADPTGAKLAASMVVHTLQLGAVGLLEPDAHFVRIDIHPEAAHWKACHKLPREPMLAVAKCARTHAPTRTHTRTHTHRLR